MGDAPAGVCPHAGDTEDNRYLGIEFGDSYQEFPAESMGHCIAECRCEE